MFQKIINFIRYHNAFAVGISLLLVLTLTAAASEDVRDAVIGRGIIIEQGIDNGAVLAADLDNLNFQLTIQDVREDGQNYYVNYSYQTLAIQNNVWQPVWRNETMTVSKEALNNRDLGLYLIEELAEIVDSELVYLKEVQKIEKEKGRIQIVQTTTFTGLLGLVLDPEIKELPGYEPVVKPPQIVIKSEIIEEPVLETEIKQAGKKESEEERIRRIVREMLENQDDQQTQIIAGATTTVATSTGSDLSACLPEWNCADWQPLPDTVCSGETFIQTRTCTDLNNCESFDEEPIEEQETIGTQNCSSGEEGETAEDEDILPDSGDTGDDTGDDTGE